MSSKTNNQDPWHVIDSLIALCLLVIVLVVLGLLLKEPIEEVIRIFLR